MDLNAATSLAVVVTKPTNPGDERVDRHRSLPSGDDGAEANERVPARTPLAVPGAASPDGNLQLDHRLEPVDVRALEQPNLNETHRPRRIASGDRAERRVPLGSQSPTRLRRPRFARGGAPPAARERPSTGNR